MRIPTKNPHEESPRSQRLRRDFAGAPHVRGFAVTSRGPLGRPVNVAVLGATGSIGQQTLDVIDRNPARLRLFGLTEGRRSTKRAADYLIQGQAGEPDFDARVEVRISSLALH